MSVPGGAPEAPINGGDQLWSLNILSKAKRFAFVMSAVVVLYIKTMCLLRVFATWDLLATSSLS